MGYQNNDRPDNENGSNEEYAHQLSLDISLDISDLRYDLEKLNKRIVDGAFDSTKQISEEINKVIHSISFVKETTEMLCAVAGGKASMDLRSR